MRSYDITTTVVSEDMVNALGKRPFDFADDMDKYLDEEVRLWFRPPWFDF